jgi:hypothetical protein
VPAVHISIAALKAADVAVCPGSLARTGVRR